MAEFKQIKHNINFRDIKSSYNIEMIFSFLNEKRKLNMIIYNKEIQKMLLIDIEDYKKISGKYKIVKQNGKGKEFILYTSKQIFEGEYLDGKRNGKGKEYNEDGELIFEGEYSKGKMNGKGKENNKYGKLALEDDYYYIDELVFEGEFLNGERNGKGKEYNYDGNLVFIREYLDGKRNGNRKYMIIVIN